MSHSITTAPKPAPSCLFVLFNTADEEVEAMEYLTAVEAEERNAKLRAHGEPQRWILEEKL